MKPIGSIVHTVNANPAPVLFLDACILLDIVRAPLRNKASEGQFARMFLASARKTPNTVHLLIAPPIPTEWQDNIVTTENDCTTAVNGCNAVASICGHLALAALGVPSHVNYSIPSRFFFSSHSANSRLLSEDKG